MNGPSARSFVQAFRMPSMSTCPFGQSATSVQDGADVAPFGSVVNGPCPVSLFVKRRESTGPGFWTPASDVDVCEPWMHMFMAGVAENMLKPHQWLVSSLFSLDNQPRVVSPY